MIKRSARKSSRKRTVSLAAAGASILLVSNIAYAQADPEFNDYNVPSGEVFASDLTDSDGITLRKYGAGTLVLDGSNTYSGATEVYGGEISLSGSTSSITQTESIDLSDGLISIWTGAGINSGSGRIGIESGDRGWVIVSGAGSSWGSIDYIHIGEGGSGELTVNAGASVSSGSSISFGVNQGGVGSALVSESATMESDQLSIGRAGEGNLYVWNGGSVIVTGSSLILGDEATGVGYLHISGSNSLVTATNAVLIGAKGDGEINIDDGGSVSSHSLIIGADTGSTGALSISGDGSLYSVTTSATVAASGSGALLVLQGGTFTAEGDLSLASEVTGDGRIVISGSGSSVTARAVYLGEKGSGDIHISSGGTLMTSGTSIMATHAGSAGELWIDGPGSEWVDTGSFGIGKGRAIITVSRGGRLETNAVIVDAGVDEVTHGDMVTIAVSGTGSIWHGKGDISFRDGVGTIALTDGGVWRADQGDAAGEGTINFLGDGSYTLMIGEGGEAGYLEAKTIAVNGGTLAINFKHNEWDYVFSTNVVDGPDMGPYGTVIQSLQGGTILTGSNRVSGARNAYGAELVVQGPEASLEAGHVGVFEGAFVVTDGARMEVTKELRVGDLNDAALVISGSGSRVDAPLFHIFGAGLLAIEKGGVLNTSLPSQIGFDGTNRVVVTGSGSQWIATTSISLGDTTLDWHGETDVFGEGILTVNDGGLVRIDHNGEGLGTLILSGSNRSQLNIGAEGLFEAVAPGTVEAALITSGSSGGGAINFRHSSESYTFHPTITGDIELYNYAGRTILAAENDYYGHTFVYGGTLVSGTQGALSDSTSLVIFGSSAVYDLNGFSEEAVSVLLNEGGSLVNGSLEIDSNAILFDGTLSAVLSGTGGAYKFGDGSVTVENDQLLEAPLWVYRGTLNLIGSIASDAEVYGGTFVVSGTAGGDLLIEGGRVVLNGILEGNATVTRGVLEGSGFIAQNLFNAGVVSPGNSPGTLTVAGNYTQSSKGTLEIEIASPTKYDRLEVGGTASLDGTLYIDANKRVKEGQKYKILTAGEGVEGEFSEVESSFGNTLRGFEVTYLSDSVVVEYSEETFTSFAKSRDLSPNQRAIAKALDRANAKGKLGNLIDTLYSTDLSHLADQISLLSPEDFSQLYRIGFATAQVQFVNLERRLSDVRSGAIGFSANGLALSDSRGAIRYDGMPIVNERDGLSLAGFDGKSIVGKNVAPIVEQSRWGFFATGVGEWADVETTNRARGSEFTTGGFTFGADYRVSDSFVVGIAGGYAHTGSDLYNGGNIDVNSGRGSLYASWFSGGAYVNGAVGGAYNAYDTKRGTIGGKARGDTYGGEFDALLGGGYDWRVGGFAIGPVGSLQYTYIGVSGFQESGSDAPLNFASQSHDSLKSLLGLKASYAWNVGGVVITPEVRAQWAHEFLDSTASIESGFVGGAGVFTVDGPNIGRDSLLLDAGVSVQFNPNVSVFAYYTGELGRTNYSSNAVNGGFRITF